MKKVIYTFIISSCIIMTAILTAHAQDGSLDITFGNGGKVITAIGNGDDFGRSVAIQSDGKIIVGGSSVNGFDEDFALIRYNNDGTLDTTFSFDGKVITDFGGIYDACFSVGIQSDGKIVLAGVSLSGPNDGFAVARYNNDGTLDSTFSADGKVTTKIGGIYDVGLSVALQSDGKIVVAGSSDNGVDNDFALVRYNTNGTLDNTFSFDGKLTLALGNGEDYGNSVAIQNDDKIIMAGYSNNGSNTDFAVVCFNNNGTLDNDFGSGGIVTTDIANSYDLTNSMAIQRDGKIVVVGFINSGGTDFAAIRYNGDGSLDSTFNSEGKVTTDFGSDDLGISVAIQNDDKIVVAGFGSESSGQDFALVRYNSDGSLDKSFDIDGKVTTDFQSHNDVGYSVAIQSDGKIVMAGFSSSDISEMDDFAVARYNVSTVGITENGTEENILTILPNPFNNELFVKGTKENELILIYDELGNEMMRQESKNEETKINTEKLIPGFYFLKYTDGIKSSTTKIVKF